MGCLPIRDISKSLPFLPDVGDNLAADALVASVAVGHNALASRDDCGTEAAENARKVVLASVDAQTRLGDAADAAIITAGRPRGNGEAE